MPTVRSRVQPATRPANPMHCWLGVTRVYATLTRRPSSAHQHQHRDEEPSAHPARTKPAPRHLANYSDTGLCLDRPESTKHTRHLAPANRACASVAMLPRPGNCSGDVLVRVRRVLELRDNRLINLSYLMIQKRNEENLSPHPTPLNPKTIKP